MELYAERLRLAAQADSEARGESLWTAEIAREVRVKLARAWKNACSGVISTDPYADPVSTFIAEVLEVSLGLESQTMVIDAASMPRYASNTPEVLSVIEAMDMTFGADGLIEGDSAQRFFRSEVNRIFEAHRVAYRLVDGQIIPADSMELNAAVVLPTLYLLHGHAELANGEKAYMKALQEIRAGMRLTPSQTPAQHSRRHWRPWAARAILSGNWLQVPSDKVSSGLATYVLPTPSRPSLNGPPQNEMKARLITIVMRIYPTRG